jgi:hypothetical protein
MATKGITGKGAILSVGVAGSPETFTAVLQIKQLSMNGVTVKYDDVSNLNSPSQGAVILEEALPATASPGEMKVSGVYLSTDPGQGLLATAYLTQNLTDFKLQFPPLAGQTTGELRTFSGFVSDMPNAVSIDFSKTILFSTTLKLNTAIAITPGS